MCSKNNTTKLIIENAKAEIEYFFHPMSSSLSIRKALYIAFSHGTNSLDKNTFSPFITLPI